MVSRDFLFFFFFLDDPFFLHSPMARPSKRAPILSSFPAPPSHIPPTPPNTANPPPTGPPSAPLPPLPSGPSRISEHDQLFLLSSLANRSLRSSIIHGSSTTRDIPNSRTTSPVSPLHLRNESISSIDMRDVLGIHAEKSPLRRQKSMADPIDPEMILSALEHSLPPAVQAASSPSYSHSHHKSLSGSYRPAHARSTSTVTAIPHTRSLSNSNTRRGLGLELSTSEALSTSPTHTNTNPTITDSYSTTTQFSTISSSPDSASPKWETTSPTTTYHHPQLHAKGRGNDHMSLDELASNKQNNPDLDTSTPRVPSPDIATILSVTPRPALSQSKSRHPHRSKSRPKSGPAQRTLSLSTTTTTTNTNTTAINQNRRQSEGAPTTVNPNVPAHGKNLSSELAYLHKSKGTDDSKQISLSRSTAYHHQEVEAGEDYEALEKVLEGRYSEDEDDPGVPWDSAATVNPHGRPRRVAEQQQGGDSDSSLDLHTPLPYAFSILSSCFI